MQPLRSRLRMVRFGGDVDLGSLGQAGRGEDEWTNVSRNERARDERVLGGLFPFPFGVFRSGLPPRIRMGRNTERSD